MTRKLLKTQVPKIIGLLVLMIAFKNESAACSGYKITTGKTTVLGSNEDAWRTTPHIWFEKNNYKYGAAFTGSRYDGENGYAPQSGMNVMGLAFERLASFHPQQTGFKNRKTIQNPTKYLKEILHNCKNVEEVKAYITQYDHSYFLEDIFFYVDKSGQYLIVEPYKILSGKDPYYVVSNFCPSITTEQKACKLARYKNGSSFLKNNTDTGLEFYTALSDTMHVCRPKIGDGTLLSSIWNLNEGCVNLYFYHNYKSTVKFNLADELNKGDHIIAIDQLFPLNPEFERLKTYKTPKNHAITGFVIVASGGLFLLTSLIFLFILFRKKISSYKSVQFTLIALGLILCFYMMVLIGSVDVFYFPAPYTSPNNLIRSLSSYIPFLIALLIIPLLLINYRIIRNKSWGTFAILLLSLFNLNSLILIGYFQYWKFYDVLG